MKNVILIVGIFFVTFLSADGHLKSEQDVLIALEKYFEARNDNDYETVVSMESKTGTYGTNSDGSFHKPRQVPSVEQWEKFDQGGITNVFYPEAIQLSEGVVLARFYAEGIVTAGGNSSDYRTRVTMNWVKEGGKWVVKSQHYSPANYGGVLQTSS